MATRRSFIAGLLATGLMPEPSWADVGNPRYLSAAMKPDATYVLCGLSSTGSITFELPLPARGHAATAHPFSPEAVVFARRPGTYAIVLDCQTGRAKAELETPIGRHFYGHGAYSGDGNILFTTENDFDARLGKIGVWDVRDRYRRVGEFSSGGIGPHDIKLVPDKETLVIANGGIETHPETGRIKLNLPTMRSNLSYLTLDGALVSQMQLVSAHQRNSIRHLAIAEDGTVAFAMQWQGNLHAEIPLLGTHSSETDRIWLAKAATARKLQGYLGSIAYQSKTERIAVTSPRSNRVLVFEKEELVSEASHNDVCGVAAARDDFMLTTGTGLVSTKKAAGIEHDLAWDNHLISI